MSNTTTDKTVFLWDGPITVWGTKLEPAHDVNISAYLLTTYRNMHRRDLTHFFSKRQSDHALRWQINIQNAPKLRETNKNFESLMSISIKKVI